MFLALATQVFEVRVINCALVVRAIGAMLQTKKKNGALWLKRLPCSRHTEMAIKMLFLTPGSDSFSSSASQDSYGEERGLVQKWLPAVLICFCLSQVGVCDETKLTELKGGPWLKFLPTFFCSKNRLGA
jgi:hypothetical protein